MRRTGCVRRFELGWCRRIVAVLLAVASMVTAMESAVAQVPTLAQPDAIERQLDQERIQLQPSLQEELPTSMTPQTDVPDGAQSITFVLKDIIIEGATVFEASDFVPIFEAFIDKEVTLEDVYGYAAQITQLYQSRGYLFSYAFLKPQKIDDGVVIITVVEGALDDVSFSGIETHRMSLLETHRERILNESPTTDASLRQLLFDIAQLPGLSAEIVYQPTEMGRGLVDILITRQKYEFVAASNNRGTRFVGPYQHTVSAGVNNGLGLLERIGFSHTADHHHKELRSAAVDVLLPVSSRGDMLTIFASRTFTQPGFSLENLNIKSFTNRAEVAYMYPLISEIGQRWAVRGSFDVFNSQTKILDTLNSEDRLRSLRLGSSYSAVDFLEGFYAASLELSQGVNILDAKDNDRDLSSRTNGRSDYTKIEYQYQRLQEIYPRVSLFMQSAGQWAFSQLLASEEFALGGSAFGRAYDNSQIIGDHGIAGIVELQYDLMTEHWRYAGMNIVNGVQLYSFYDLGAIWQFGSEVTNDRQTLSSAGFGVRTQLLDHLDFNLEAAKPLTRPAANDNTPDNDVRYFVGLNMRFTGEDLGLQ